MRRNGLSPLDGSDTRVEGRQGQRRLRFFVGLCVTGALLTACSDTSNLPLMRPTQPQLNVFNPNFKGGAAADEPQAALIARDVLARGGSAADAAVATFFTLTVTYPIAASLGGGGVCLIHDHQKKTMETLEFPARAAAGGGPVAVPGVVRGMAALHARYGRLDWRTLLGPAESLARFGVPASRALVRRLEPVSGSITQQPDLMKILGRNGEVVSEGQMVEQLELASMLGQIRSRGGGDFYTGASARQYVEAVQVLGADLTTEDLRSYRADWRKAILIKHESRWLNFSNTVGGRRAAWQWLMIQSIGNWGRMKPEERAHILMETSARAYGQTGNPSVEKAKALIADFDLNRKTYQTHGQPIRLSQEEGTTSFVVGDSTGSGVACTVSLNGPFGVGRTAPGTGIVMGATPEISGDANDYIAVAMIYNETNQQLFAAVTADGGTPAPSIAAGALADIEFGENSLAEIIAAPRMFSPGEPDVGFIEVQNDNQLLTGLSQRGHKMQDPSPPFGRLSILYCTKGLQRAPETCEIRTESRGFGLATTDLIKKLPGE